MNRLVETFRSLLQGAPAVDPKRDGDGDLLARYCRDGDAEGFTRLVARHTPLVYRVCRGVLADDHDAEDATQAVFLALSQHARSVRRQESVAGWLHGVALHTARSYRRKLGRSRARDAAHAVPEAAATPDAFDELSVREAREVLHAELDRLPERYRSPLVLIYFEELSHAAATPPAASRPCSASRSTTSCTATTAWV